MTCARRPAGARKPASPTSADSRRPDARTGRSRVRLSLLPVLALLLGALSPFAAGTAEAQTPTTLVSSIGQTKAANPLDTSTDSTAQGFTTGGDASGYVLAAIELNFQDAINSSQMATVRAELWSAATGGGPGSKLADLTAPSSIAAGANAVFTAPANTRTAAEHDILPRHRCCTRSAT